MKNPEIILKDHGFNCTQMQIATLDILIHAEKPMARADILNALDERNPDKTTIYRILERFCEKGIVHKAYVDKRAWEYELADKCTDNQCHPHFKCTNCGKVTCLHDVNIPLIKGLGKDFIFHRQKIMIEGIGPECSAEFIRSEN
jgi:Fur family transcriptional regulator, ferric uptake regulator